MKFGARISMIFRTREIWTRSLIVGAVTGLCGVALILSPLGTTLEEEVGLGWLFQVRGPVEPPREVAVVAIDGTTGRELGLGKLPRDWPRTVHAKLVESLNARQVAVSVLDIDFGRVRSGYEDSILALAIAAADRIILFERLVGRRQPVEGPDGKAGGWTWVEEKQSPSPLLAKAATALAPFSLPKLGRAAIQFWTFKPSLGDLPTTPAVALQLYALPVYERWREVLDAAGAPGVSELPTRAEQVRGADQVRMVMGRLRQMFLADPELADRVRSLVETPKMAGGDAAAPLLRALVAMYAGPRDRYLYFYGPPGTIKTIPYAKLVGLGATEGEFIPIASGDSLNTFDLRDHVVFVGYSDLYEPDQPDRFYTVFTDRNGIDLSGVEIIATAFANLLTARTLQPTNAAISAVLLLIFGLLVGMLASSLPALWAIPLTLAAATLCAWFNQVVFNTREVWLPVATPFLVQLPLALLLGLMSQYLIGRLRQQRMSKAMSYYVPQEIIRDLTERGVNPDAVNKVVYGTCLATDMSGFSTISETKSPKEMAAFMNSYFDSLSQTLKRHGVDVTEFHADTIMCAWTAAEPKVEVRRNAALAGVDVIQAIRDFSERHGSLGLYPRVGLQDGFFYVGHTGGGGRLAYSILGDTANAAARLESFNKHLGTHLLAAQSVVRDIEDLLLIRPLGSFRLVGKTDATPVVEILTRKDAASPEQRQLCERFTEALELFRAQRWVDAAGLFKSMIDSFSGDGPSSFYWSHCQRCAAEGPGGGDPTVIRLDVK